MSGYYIRLALKSFGRNPGLTALMVCAIALGIGVCIMTLTVYHAMSGNPIWWKNDRLYAVTLDSWSPNEPANKRRPALPPTMLTYKDAMYLIRSDIPERKVVMFQTNQIISGGTADQKPERLASRVTTADFFALFDVPFRYGSGWTASADQGPEPVIVLSRHENDRLFGGIDSVGRTVRWNDREFRIVGVLDDWHPEPKFYDLNNGSFAVPENVYVPFGWTTAMELPMNNSDGWKAETVNTFKDLMGSETVWLQMWVELPDAASRESMQSFLDSYWSEQRSAGRFQRPRNNRLTDVGQWLKDQQVIENDSRVLVAVAFAFLAVCLINTVGLLLAKFLNGATTAGVRRALGASRKQIFMQHLVEVGALASLGALLGLALAVAGLWAVHAVYAASQFNEPGGYQELAHFDTAGIFWAIGLALLATLAAGLYPAWRIGQMPPAVYLKSQ